CRSWRMPSKRRALSIPTCWPTCGGPDPTFAGAGDWMGYSTRGEGEDEGKGLTDNDPWPIMEALPDKGTGPTVLLCQRARRRRCWDVLADGPCREAVLVAERFADGNATDRGRRAIRKQVADLGDADDLTAINARYAVFRANEKTTGRKPFFLGVAAVVGRAAN